MPQVSTTRRKAPARGKKKAPASTHQLEVWGVALVVGGILAALSIWVHLTGPFGRALRDGSWSLVGTASYALPLLLAWAGGLLVRGKTDDRRRIGGSVALLVVSVDGLASLLRHPTTGGFLGQHVTDPLQSVLAAAGAFVVLAAVGLAGVLLFTKTTPRTAVHYVGAVARPIGDTVVKGVRWLETLG